MRKKGIQYWGENLLWKFINKLYLYLGERRFVRGIIEKNVELTYEQVRNIWEDESVMVHGDMSKPQYYYSCIDEVLNFEEKDCVLDIGCGDGIIDSYIQVDNLFGIDVSENKLAEAKKRNPRYIYQAQSFLDRIDCKEIKINKCFSYSVVQYCKPEDISMLIRNSIDVVLKNWGGRALIAHIEVPDIEKAYSYYQRIYGINESCFNKYKDKVRTIFQDGSYWHDMRLLENISKAYLEEKGLGSRSVVYLSNSRCNYRTNLVILLNL